MPEVENWAHNLRKMVTRSIWRTLNCQQRHLAQDKATNFGSTAYFFEIVLSAEAEKKFPKKVAILLAITGRAENSIFPQKRLFPPKLNCTTKLLSWQIVNWEFRFMTNKALILAKRCCKRSGSFTSSCENWKSSNERKICLLSITRSIIGKGCVGKSAFQWTLDTHMLPPNCNLLCLEFALIWVQDPNVDMSSQFARMLWISVR